MANLIRMDLYRMWKAKAFRICLILTFVLSLAQMPLLKLLSDLGRMLSPDSAADLFPKESLLSAEIGSPFSLFTPLLILLSMVIFFYADMETGYIKNIAGQMPKRGFSILSRYLAAIVHNGVFMVVSLAGCLIGCVLVQHLVVDGAIASGILYFFLKLLLLQSLCAILLFVTSGLGSKSFGMILAVLFGVNAMALLYSGIDSGLGLIFKSGFTIKPYMPDTLMFMDTPETLRAILSAGMTIAIFLPASISLFNKRDVK